MVSPWKGRCQHTLSGAPYRSLTPPILTLSENGVFVLLALLLLPAGFVISSNQESLRPPNWEHLLPSASVWAGEKPGKITPRSFLKAASRCSVPAPIPWFLNFVEKEHLG